MQVCTCTVNLGGSLTHQRPEKIVTVAEIQVLRHVHGPDSVIAIVPTVVDHKRKNGPELERLRNEYGADAVGAVFPGSFPALPTTLREIGIDPKSQAKALREAAKKQLEIADQLDSAEANEGGVTTDKEAKSPKTLDDIFETEELAA